MRRTVLVIVVVAVCTALAQQAVDISKDVAVGEAQRDIDISTQVRVCFCM
jgi:hypothetical protein